MSLRGVEQHIIYYSPCPRQGGPRNNDTDKGVRLSRCLPFILFHTNKDGDREIQAQLTVTSKVLSLNPDPDTLTPAGTPGKSVSTPVRLRENLKACVCSVNRSRTYDFAVAGGGFQVSGGEASHDSYFPTFDDSLSVSRGWEHLKPGQVRGAAFPLSLLRQTEVVIKSA